MRLNEISYKPSALPDDQRSIKALKEYIEANCGPWLKASKGHYVYRGINRDYASLKVFTRNIRTNRHPVDSTKGQQEFFNEVISIAGGTANRSNSMFVYGNVLSVLHYGKSHYAFPIGDFEYTWAPKWRDWYNDRVKFFKAYGDLNNTDISIEERNAIVEKIKRDIYVNRGLVRAITSGKEIMVLCEKALFVNKSEYFLGDSW
jgi:hypothetical protein